MNNTFDTPPRGSPSDDGHMLSPRARQVLHESLQNPQNLDAVVVAVEIAAKEHSDFKRNNREHSVFSSDIKELKDSDGKCTADIAELKSELQGIKDDSLIHADVGARLDIDRLAERVDDLEIARNHPVCECQDLFHKILDKNVELQCMLQEVLDSVHAGKENIDTNVIQNMMDVASDITNYSSSGGMSKKRPFQSANH